jgi:PAS domain S-box-containing protein
LKIRRQLNVLMAVCALAITLTFVLMLTAASAVNQRAKESAAAEELIRSATQLRQIAVETVLFHEARSRDQWQRKLVVMRADLKKVIGDNRIETVNLAIIGKNIALAQKVYARLAATADAGTPATVSAVDAALEARTISSLFVITEEMLDSGYEVIRSNRADAAKSLREMQMSIALFVLCVVSMLGFVWRLVNHRLLGPLRQFDAATQRLAGGDYGVRLYLPADDEIGELGRQFDQMSAQVQATQSALKVEVDNSHRAEVALQESARTTQTLLDNVIDGIISIDGEGRVNSFNLAAETIFGYPAGEVIGRNVKMLMPAPSGGEHDGALNDFERGGEARSIGIGHETVGRRSDGTTFAMDLAVSRSTHQGQPLFIGVVRDITERKRIEQLKSEFVSTVSHELRTPLTSIGGALGLIVGGVLGEVPVKMGAMLDIAHKNCLRLSHLINDLLDMEKLAAGKMAFDFQAQPLMPLVELSIESLRAYGQQFEVGIELAERADQVQVRVDASRLQQVLSNLLSNALKFSPPGARVTVRVAQQGRVVRVEVIDHGKGISQAFRDRIFQKFSQADASDTREKGGTGLGLAISKEIIERMNGLVGFESEPGLATRFHFELPVWDGAFAAMPEPTNTGGAGALRLLVVEDEPDVAHLLAVLLGNAGYRVDVAGDGETAWKRLMTQQYAGVTLDLMLPNSSGVSLIRRIRDEPRMERLPIIVVSAYVADGQLAINGQFHAIDWLTKPFDNAQLVRTVRAATDAHAALPGARRARILHVEDDPDLTEIFRALTTELADFDIAPSLAEARLKLGQHVYDIVVLDLGLPDGNGWELMEQLRALKPAPAVVVLSSSELTAVQQSEVRRALLKSPSCNADLLELIRELAEPV